MAFTMERWYEATGQRFSVRKYEKGPGEEDWQALQKQAEALCAHGVRIVLSSSEKAFTSLLGSNRVKGTTHFAAFLSKESKAYSVGYLGEAFVLECAALGMGTCWMGMYNKKAVAAALQLQEGETLTCITPIGLAAEKYSSRPRKPLNKLTGLDQAQLQALPEWQQFALECARRAPSAMNAQPWRFVVEKEALRVVNAGGNYGFGKLDCGIAMLHMELGAAHGGVAGEWEFEKTDAVFKPTSFGN